MGSSRAALTRLLLLTVFVMLGPPACDARRLRPDSSDTGGALQDGWPAADHAWPDGSTRDLAKPRDRATDTEGVNGPGGTLQFRSGFEPNVVVVDQQHVQGVDLKAPAGKNDWDSIPSYLGWPLRVQGHLEGGAMSLVADPKNPANRVLHFHNAKLDSQYHRSRTQLSIIQFSGWTDNGAPNKFDKQFYRYRMLVPGHIREVSPRDKASRWYVIFEQHIWDLDTTRHVINLYKQANSDLWYFDAEQQHPQGTITWESTTRVEVPFDTWFTLEIFFKYHSTQGEFFIAVTRSGGQREIVGRLQGPTRHGTKLRDQMVMKMYHHGDYITWLKAAGYDGTHQYFDDFEIWSDYPPGYW